MGASVQALLASYNAARAACTITHGVTLNDTTDGAVNTLQNYTTGAFTPAANDLLVVFVGWSTASGGAAGTISLSSSSGLTFTQQDIFSTGAVRQIAVFVADSLAAATLQTVTAAVTPSGGVAAGGCNITVLRVAGMSKVSTAAKRQTANISTGTGGTPAPVFGSSALTNNPCLGAVFNGTNPATMTPPAGWTEQNDSAFATPTSGVETAARASGFTGTTVTWASTTASNALSMIIELDNT
jgi:hypothetical protein